MQDLINLRDLEVPAFGVEKGDLANNDMDTEHLKLLGFHLVEKDPITTRGSRLGGRTDDVNTRSS